MNVSTALLSILFDRTFTNQKRRDMKIIDELERLNNLREKGAISDQEYQEFKTALLENNQQSDNKEIESINKKTSDEKLWCTFIHLSQLCSFLIPFSGFIIPIVIWQIKKGESEFLNINGIIVANWIISKVIYYAIFIFLCFVFIGIPLIWGLAMLSIIFPIIGAIKSNSGEIWRYPLSINFIKVENK